MSTSQTVSGKELIKALLELTGTSYCKQVKGVTVRAYVGEPATITVEMIAIKEAEDDG
jgi:hypothetical protein